MNKKKLKYSKVFFMFCFLNLVERCMIDHDRPALCSSPPKQIFQALLFSYALSNRLLLICLKYGGDDESR